MVSEICIGVCIIAFEKVLKRDPKEIPGRDSYMKFQRAFSMILKNILRDSAEEVSDGLF